MSFRLQSVESPDDPPMVLFRLSQTFSLSFGHPPQQSQKLAIQLAHASLIDQDPSLVQFLLNLDQLLVLLFVLPANERQHIQSIGVGLQDIVEKTGTLTTELTFRTSWKPSA
jgi:hypothetical protein